MGSGGTCRGAPTVGETAGENLRNLRFTYMIGERDTAYGRLIRCQAFEELIKGLKSSDGEGYPVQMMYQAGRAHSDLPDLGVAKEMMKHRREAVPVKVVWKLTDPVVKNFYWLAVEMAGKGMSIEAECKENVVTLKTEKVEGLTVYLDRRLVDFAKPVRVVVDGKEVFAGKVAPRLSVLCRTLAERGDVNLAFDVEIKK